MLVVKKILLVEDDYFTRFMMEQIIEVLEVDVDVASNGQEGCNQIEKCPSDYGLVLMDIHMPKMSGLEAAHQIRSNPNDPPRSVAIIAVTADEQYHNDAVVRQYGMDGFLSKPISPGGLLGLIDKYCTAA